MKKTFDYAVKYHGKFYPANTPIEVDEGKITTEDKKTAEMPKKTAKKAVKENDETAD